MALVAYIIVAFIWATVATIVLGKKYMKPSLSKVGIARLTVLRLSPWNRLTKKEVQMPSIENLNGREIASYLEDGLKVELLFREKDGTDAWEPCSNSFFWRQTMNSRIVRVARVTSVVELAETKYEGSPKLDPDYLTAERDMLTDRLTEVATPIIVETIEAL